MMVESFFGITHSAIEYYLTISQFEFIVKFIMENKYGINKDYIDIRIDSINDETVFVFNNNYKDDIFIKIIRKPYSYKNEKEVKRAILFEMFQSNNINEKVIYKEAMNFKAKGITFTIKNEVYDNNNAIRIINDPQIDRINAQIDVLHNKKIEIIQSNKR